MIGIWFRISKAVVVVNFIFNQVRTSNGHHMRDLRTLLFARIIQNYTLFHTKIESISPCRCHAMYRSSVAMFVASVKLLLHVESRKSGNHKCPLICVNILHPCCACRIQFSNSISPRFLQTSIIFLFHMSACFS